MANYKEINKQPNSKVYCKCGRPMEEFDTKSFGVDGNYIWYEAVYQCETCGNYLRAYFDGKITDKSVR